MELDLLSLFGLLCTAVLIDGDPAAHPPPAFGLIYEGAIGQQIKTLSLCIPVLFLLWNIPPGFRETLDRVLQARYLGEGRGAWRPHTPGQYSDSA
jgi:hypothetical protein